MLPILIVSSIITPAFIWLLLFFNITDQYIEDENGDLNMIETKADAQQYVLSRTIKSPFSWIYISYTTMWCCIIIHVVF